jgi:hypothetical protein
MKTSITFSLPDEESIRMLMKTSITFSLPDEEGYPEIL